MSKRPVAIQLSRLDKALKAQGVELKRHQLLEVSAAAFGYRNSNALTAAANDIVPHEAKPIGVIEHDGERVVLARDVLSNSIFAVDETFLEQVSAEEDAETWLPTPYGHLAAINKLLDQPLPAIANPFNEDVHYITSRIDDEVLFWNNSDGWVDFASATPFPDAKGRLPLSKGTVPEWVSRFDAVILTRNNALEAELGKDIVKRAREIAKCYPPLIATFTPQAWVNDYAIEVDPEGETTFDVTLDVIARALADECDTIEEYLDGTDNDELRYADEAPEWIYDWSGPFNIEVDAPMAALIANLAKVEAGEEYRLFGFECGNQLTSPRNR